MVAGRALKANMTTLGPLVLPYSEQVRGHWGEPRGCRTVGHCSRAANLPAVCLRPC
jgi:hypothetical protein